jgi:plastocyanin
MKTPSQSKAATRTLVAVALVSFAWVLQAGAGMGAPGASTTHTIVIAEMKFVPETLTVSRGDTVLWVNKDFFPHTATAQDRSFDSGDIATDKSWKYVATENGTFSYICTLHPTMKATLVVK